MTVDDFAVFSERLIELGELFDATLSDSKQMLYFEALRDLDLTLVLPAIVSAARTCKFFPRPVELRTLAVGDDADHAEEAWQTYKAMALRIGGYQSPTFADAALAETLVAIFGSWEAACWVDLSPEMWVAKRKEFDRVYRVLRQRGLVGPKALPGFCERENALKGYAPDGRTLAGGPVDQAQLPASTEVDA